VTPADLTAWRQRMGLNKQQAAEALGLSINGYAAYERGYIGRDAADHRHMPRPIPLHVALACAALKHGLRPEDSHLDNRKPRRIALGKRRRDIRDVDE
jgi:transcriptional regulator with XRE-family HTH domain